MHSRFSAEAIRRACEALPPPQTRTVIVEIESPRRAAVLVPLIDTGDEVDVLVTQRTDSMRHHSHDWVFPGGGLDPGDATSAAGAVREASEELGVARSAFEILGQLDTRGPIITGYLIEVFVGLVSPSAPWRPSQREVCAIETRPLRHFVDPRNSFRAPIDPAHDPGPTVALEPAPSPTGTNLLHFVIRPGEHLWGLQADILSDLICKLDLGPTRGAHTEEETCS